MTYDKSIFQSYTTISGQFVGVGGGNKLPIIGTGNVRIQIIVEGTQRTCMLMGAYHVPELGYSLVSVPSLDKRKLYTQFGDQRCLIKNHSEVLLATGTIQGNVYKLDVDSSRQVHSQALIASDISIWHKRLAHIDPASVMKMHKDGCVLGLEISPYDESPQMCDDCIIGKGHRHPFPKASSSRTSKLLELVHSDVNGPLEIPSLGGSRYFILFIDDYSKWTVVYTMKKKSESIKCFEKYHKLAETHTGKKIVTVNTVHRSNQPKEKIMALRTDNGGQYVSNAFKAYLQQHGIQHQTTITLLQTKFLTVFILRSRSAIMYDGGRMRG